MDMESNDSEKSVVMLSDADAGIDPAPVEEVVASGSGKTAPSTTEPNDQAKEHESTTGNKTREKNFTTEIFKVEVRNLGMYGVGELRRFLREKLSLDVSKIKTPGSRDYAFVCFRSKEDQMRAIELLNGYRWKTRTLHAFEARATSDPLQRRRQEQEQKRRQSSQNGDEAANTSKKKQRTSADATCPLSAMPYAEQVAEKNTEMIKLLHKFTQELRRLNRSAATYARRFRFDGTLVSPIIDGYRNKNEFTVGNNRNGEPLVGFRLGTYAQGSIEVAEIDDLPHIPAAAKWAAHSFQNFVRKSRFVPFNPENNSGHIRQLMVRTSATSGEIMLVVGIYSSNLSANEVATLKHELIEYYDQLSNAQPDGEYKISSLYYQDVKQREAGQMVNPVEHLSGKKHINDSIHKLNFIISPLSFFQINTEAANVLYQKIIDLAAPTPETTILDICCGTGTIGLALAKHCRKVLGVELIPEAIQDANFNAANNNIDNCKFIAGNADDYIASMAREAVYDTPPNMSTDIVAIVDPPRAGLHNRSIIALRAANHIKRIVYVSCNPHRAYKNWLDLARPTSKTYKNDPFFPIAAVAVDMFPHTSHTELVVLLKRIDPETLARDQAAAELDEAQQTKPPADPVAVQEILDDKDANDDDDDDNANGADGGRGTAAAAAAADNGTPNEGDSGMGLAQRGGAGMPAAASIETIVIEDSEDARRRFEESLVDEEPDEIPLAWG